MTESFKQQLQELIERAAEKFDERNNQETDYYCPYSFKQGCEFLMPVLMKAVEQRDQSEKVFGRSCYANDAEVDEGIKGLNQELLNILKGDK